MTNRRQFLAGLLATGLIPNPTWADAGNPAFLAAAGMGDGSYWLCGISADRDVLFRIALDGRGHAAAAHPTRPEAVAFARRPGLFASVIDCARGIETATLTPPSGRHFYGHGVFSQDGDWLFTTENDFENGRGMVGVWDARQGYSRVGEFASGGIGPHDIKRLPDTDTLVIANGGIDTRPDSGRTKLNIADMAPNLSYLVDGGVVEVMSLPKNLHKNSIRHLALSDAGDVAFGMQWQGGPDSVPLIGMHRRGGDVRLLMATQDEARNLKGYVGSITFSADQGAIVVTSSPGGRVQFYGVADGQLQRDIETPDASGVAVQAGRLIVSAGTGDLYLVGRDAPAAKHVPGFLWDNHLIAV